MAQIIDGRDLSRINAGFRAILKDFEKKSEQRKILTPAASKVRKVTRDKARPSVWSYKHAPKKTQGNRGAVSVRYSNGRPVAWYYKGNLRRSIKTFRFRRSKALFVGPTVSGSTKGDIGLSFSNADGYYAQMIFGSASAFFDRILGPALVQAEPAARAAAEAKAKELADKSIKRNGFKAR